MDWIILLSTRATARPGMQAQEPKGSPPHELNFIVQAIRCNALRLLRPTRYEVFDQGAQAILVPAESTISSNAAMPLNPALDGCSALPAF